MRLSKPSNGVLIVAEGIETALACLAAVGPDYGVVVMPGMPISMRALAFLDSAIAFGEAEAIHTFIIAGDCDTFREPPRPSWVGQRAAVGLRERLVTESPWLTVEVRVPTCQWYPDLVAPAGKDPYEHPRAGKSVDWLDCLQSRRVAASA